MLPEELHRQIKNNRFPQKTIKFVNTSHRCFTDRWNSTNWWCDYTAYGDNAGPYDSIDDEMGLSKDFCLRGVLSPNGEYYSADIVFPIIHLRATPFPIQTDESRFILTSPRVPKQVPWKVGTEIPKFTFEDEEPGTYRVILETIGFEFSFEELRELGAIFQ